MARADDVQNDSWGTWEELLLACAVNRHGTRNWDSVAMELQTRTTSPLILTAQNCKHKYRDLQTRFTTEGGKFHDGGDENDHKAIPWLEELRRLRVAELRREVQRYDVSIVSLQLKVKKLTDERERSLHKKDNGGEKLDLVKDEANDDKTDEKEKGSLDEKSSPANVAQKHLTGDESDRENRSFSESNSTDPKEKNRETGREQPDTRPEERLAKPETAAGKADLTPTDSAEENPVREASYNGSSDTVAKCPPVSPQVKSPEAVRPPDSGESTEFRESVAESNAAKESSDVQSSASLSKKIRGKRKQTGDISGEEPEADELSPVSKRTCVKLEPFVGLLEIIRSHKHGSLFERRLESQETEDYQRAIRQHVDLETVRSKLEEGLYAESTLEFFRDLLLLCNNAIVFFPKNCMESTAAFQLREIVTKELRTTIRTTNPPSKEETQASVTLPAKPSLNTPTPPNNPEKPNASAPSTLCRKRSSIALKASDDSKAADKAKTEVEEKPDVEPVEPDNSSANLNTEHRITKKRTRERSGTGPRGARTGKGRSNGNNSNSKAPSSSPNPSSSAKATPTAEDAEKENTNTVTVAKKRSAANFLNRMKRNSSSNGTLLETLKSTVNSANNSKGQDVKKGGKGDGRRDQNSRAGSASKQVMPEQNIPVTKRSVGRPPKKATQQSAVTPAAPARGRKEPGGMEMRTPARKRARR
ncbi:uncharacterized protein [Aristolochia californica]|uniref:uncharacterized protein n=1 Tax=Aristolochia californica TaxID=171875 RepID=UPI0035D6F5C7